jgi:hypothetical protein
MCIIKYMYIRFISVEKESAFDLLCHVIYMLHRIIILPIVLYWRETWSL